MATLEVTVQIRASAAAFSEICSTCAPSQN